jgi:aspartate 1-decarboxylase
MLKSKIHRATVTGCDPDYLGSITAVLLDSSLASEADFEVPGNVIHEGSYR